MIPTDALNQEFRISKSDMQIGNQSSPLNETRSIKNAQEAAKQFEKVLVQQFVQVMTEQMFKSNLAGEDGPGWMKSYGNQQQDTLTDILSEHLVERGTFNISSDILKQWAAKGYDIE